MIMSKMSRFVYECQEIAESNYNETSKVVEYAVYEQFANRPEMRDFALETTMAEWHVIQQDLSSVWEL
jgi:hypothetical protein